MTVPKRFVNVQKLFKIAATLSLTSCSAERCFNKVKLLKARIRCKMEDDRLNGLALLYFHQKTDIPVDNVIAHFAMNIRKLNFAF
jgi:hAT family C-terminal dimerisation region